MPRTSVDIPEDLYRAFQTAGGTLSVVVREAIRDWLGVKGASEDALAVLELKSDRLTEEKLRHESRVQELENLLASVQLRIKQIKQNIHDQGMISEQARIMREEVNPYIRAVNYELKSMTPELHGMLLKLAEIGLTHNLESLQRWARKLGDADYLRDVQ